MTKQDPKDLSGTENLKIGGVLMVTSPQMHIIYVALDVVYS